ncbi:hypothetical protein IG631_02475 [Alternaria alternata]|nr:hypothetical protein IG631_02475 [Alternaria alternata]
MAPLPDSTVRVANGATTGIAPANANPLPGKSINADFQIRYVEDELRRNEPVPQNGEPLVETTPGKEDDASSNAEAQKNWWAEAIAKNMDIADGYTKVAVLLIKWADHLDELRTADEVYLGEAHRDRID